MLKNNKLLIFAILLGSIGLIGALFYKFSSDKPQQENLPQESLAEKNLTEKSLTPDEYYNECYPNPAISKELPCISKKVSWTGLLISVNASVGDDVIATVEIAKKNKEDNVEQFYIGSREIAKKASPADSGKMINFDGVLKKSGSAHYSVESISNFKIETDDEKSERLKAEKQAYAAEREAMRELENRKRADAEQLRAKEQKERNSSLVQMNTGTEYVSGWNKIVKYLYIQSKVNDLWIDEIIINDGACSIMTEATSERGWPKSLNQGKILRLFIDHCGSLNSIVISTNKGRVLLADR